MYFEGEVPTVVTGNGNNGGFGNGFSDGWWGIILIALLFGWGRNGNGFGNFGGNDGCCGGNLAYHLGQVATTNDVASGFNNSAVLSSLNDLKLGQTNGFAGVQQTLCQGFSGVNQSLERGISTLGYNMATGFHGVDNAICTLGYNFATGINGLSREIADCCCSTKQAIADVKYANERQTCELITNANANTQRILDYLCAEKINTITAENVALKGQISNYNQTNAIVNALKQPCPIPAYQVPNPNCCYNSCSGCGNNF